MLALAPISRGSSRGRATLPGRPVGLARQDRSGGGGSGCLPRRSSAALTNVVAVAKGNPYIGSIDEQVAAREVQVDWLSEKRE